MRLPPRLLRCAAVWLSALAALASSLPACAAKTYTFAVVPQFEQHKLFGIWLPIIDELERRTGLRFKLIASLRTVPETERQLSAGAFDFVYANPYQIMREGGRQGYIPLVRDSVPVRGILVVRKDSPIKSLAELDGKPLAVPSLNAIGASLLLRADLSRLYHVKLVPLNVKTHSSVYLHVVNGLTPAGGGVEKTLQQQDKAVRDALKVLYTTREIPSHPIAAHPRVPAKDREKVRQAFLDMNGTKGGRELLSKIPMKQAVPASLEDYLPMRAWGLESYWVEE